MAPHPCPSSACAGPAWRLASDWRQRQTPWHAPKGGGGGGCIQTAVCLFWSRERPGSPENCRVLSRTPYRPPLSPLTFRTATLLSLSTPTSCTSPPSPHLPYCLAPLLLIPPSSRHLQGQPARIQCCDHRHALYAGRGEGGFSAIVMMPFFIRRRRRITRPPPTHTHLLGDDGA